jgi:uncharacterized membrane protein YhhN
MNKNLWIILFVIALLADIAGILLPDKTVQYISKPFIVISLVGYFVTVTAIYKRTIKKWILFALAFSWLGDVLLMFENKDELFFFLGLSAFLLAHIFYIICFIRVQRTEKLRSNLFILTIAVLYGVLILKFLLPHLGKMKWPVLIYGAIITVMFTMALHMIFLKNKQAGYLMATGALLFVTSDSVLAINKFYHSFELAGFIIILTYGLAQFLIAEGAIQYIRRRPGHNFF